MGVLRYTLRRNTWVRDLERFARAYPDAVNPELHRAGAKMFAALKRALPRDSGELSGSYVFRAGDGFAVVGTPLNRARFQEFGTRTQEEGREVLRAVEQAREGLRRRILYRLRRAV